MLQPIRVNVLGDFNAVRGDGMPSEFRTSRAKEVIARLALLDSRQMHRDELASDIWPDYDYSTRMANLRPALSYARKGLGTPESLLQTGDIIALERSVVSDWDQIEQFEAKAQAIQQQDEKLIVLFGLSEALSKPLLKGWDAEWIDPYRNYYTFRQETTIRQIAEGAIARSDWSLGLEYATKLSQINPYDEDAIRLKLVSLGALGRRSEAHREFATYTKFTSTELDVTPSPDLRQLITSIVSGRFKPTESFGNTVQKDLLWQILNDLVDSSPERVLPILATSALNWSIAVSGSELRNLLERVFHSTTGWGADRKGLALRLLHIYSLEFEGKLSIELATELLANSSGAQRVPPLNFIALAQAELGRLDLAEASLRDAIQTAEEASEVYYAAVSRTNLATTLIKYLRLTEARIELIKSRADLQLRTETNALFSVACAKSWLTFATWLEGDLQGANIRATDWFQYCVTHGLLPYDSFGRAAYALCSSSRPDSTGRNALLAAVHASIAEKGKVTQLQNLPLLVAAARPFLNESDIQNLVSGVASSYAVHKATVLPAFKQLLGEHKVANRDFAPFELLLQLRTLILRSQ